VGVDGDDVEAAGGGVEGNAGAGDADVPSAMNSLSQITKNKAIKE
jgi:hypothetical protein